MTEIRPHGKEAEERKAKETGHCVTTPRLALTVVLAGVYILIRKERCDTKT